MLEKLKALLGDAFTEELGAKLDAAIAESYVSKTDFDAVTTQNGELKTQLGEASNAIAGFKAMDIDSIKKAADDWKVKAEQAEKDATAKIADMQFSNLISGAIGTAKGKNAKAIFVHYSDNGYTDTGINRPMLKAMCTDIENGKISAIFVQDIAHLGCNYLDVSAMLTDCFPPLYTCKKAESPVC
ncbi:MAG: phage scaffolding protein [Oscillospiraceae bacterium]